MIQIYQFLQHISLFSYQVVCFVGELCVDVLYGVLFVTEVAFAGLGPCILYLICGGVPWKIRRDLCFSSVVSWSLIY